MIRRLPLLPLIAVLKNARTPLPSRQINGSKLEDTSSVLPLVFCELIIGGRKEARVAAWISGLAAGDGVGERVRIYLRQPSLRMCSIHSS
jgi:hypothetical protein